MSTVASQITGVSMVLSYYIIIIIILLLLLVLFSYWLIMIPKMIPDTRIKWIKNLTLRLDDALFRKWRYILPK